MRVFRLCSLWFDNANEEFVSEMIKVCQLTPFISATKLKNCFLY